MSKELKPCPFLCEMRDFEIGMESQVIGYLCKAQCEKCPAHNNTVKSLQAENKKLKSDLDGQKLVSKIAYADIKKLGDENEMLKKELSNNADEGYVGFMLGIEQMKKKLDEKDKEIEWLKGKIARIKMLLVFRRNVLLNANSFNGIEITSEYNALNLIIESINAPDNNVGNMEG